ncbi:hypothetical protein E2562_030773 [Oryza meyeriana var. granulata]|uniref:Uncharacterized protein n=1 Tax=Oryza meyeriana var. granulata TaxID=110450 RepID=A0A6G1CAU3_9ORYZ|nr:hypothetical protein E2562_030773 [Oryza meyeriana var. granulata]
MEESSGCRAIAQADGRLRRRSGARLRPTEAVVEKGKELLRRWKLRRRLLRRLSEQGKKAAEFVSTVLL